MITTPATKKDDKDDKDWKRDDKDAKGDPDAENLAELADRLGLRDHDGKIDLEAAKRVQGSERENKAAVAKAEKAAKGEVEAEPKDDKAEPKTDDKKSK
ncbi:MAG TPA: hypothetical protein VJ829_03770 [Candidatus Binatia bacterium]|nr:hypothetical protein [Candidatus Binatia bacterium]